MQPSDEIKRPLLREAGVNFSVAALLPVVLSFVVVLIFQAAMGAEYSSGIVYRYLSFLLPQVAFAGAAILFFRRTRYSPAKIYRCCKWYDFLFAVILSAGLFFTFNQLNEYFIRFLELLGYTRQAAQPGYHTSVTADMVTGFMLLPTLLIVAVLPALFEETIFRGIQLTAMRESGWGTVSVVLLSGALFSLFHGNPEQTLYQFACGAVYALLAVRSGSVIPTMVSHFLNNAVILIIAACCGVEWEIPQEALLWLSVGFGILLAATVVYLAVFDRRNRSKGPMSGKGGYFLAAAAGIAVCAVEWIAMLVQGFAV